MGDGYNAVVFIDSVGFICVRLWIACSILYVREYVFLITLYSDRTVYSVYVSCFTCGLTLFKYVLIVRNLISVTRLN